MTPEEKAQLQFHADAIAKLLYKDSDPSTMTTLEDIEVTVREQLQAHVSPEIGSFLSKRSAEHKTAE